MPTLDQVLKQISEIVDPLLKEGFFDGNPELGKWVADTFQPIFVQTIQDAEVIYRATSPDLIAVTPGWGQRPGVNRDQAGNLVGPNILSRNTINDILSNRDMIDGLAIVPKLQPEQIGTSDSGSPIYSNSEAIAMRAIEVANGEEVVATLKTNADSSETQRLEIGAELAAKSNATQAAAETSTTLSDSGASAVKEAGLNMNAAAKADKRTAGKRKADGKRVSCQSHEYDYCLQSGQIQRLLAGFASLIDRAGDIDAAVPVPADHWVRGVSENFLDFVDDNRMASLFSYGNFVDAVNFRKMIAIGRKLHRFAFSANVKAIAGLLGKTRLEIEEELFQAAYDSVEIGLPVFLELAQIFSDGGPADHAGSKPKPTVSTTLAGSLVASQASSDTGS